MKDKAVSPPEEVVLDDARLQRIGLDEAIYCQGKSPAQTDSILAASIRNRTPRLLTRLDGKSFEALDADHRSRLDYDPVSCTAILAFDRKPDPGSDLGSDAAASKERAQVTVASAGTSDIPAAKEAVRTLAYYKEAVQEIHDIGVAGLWRLLDRLDDIRSTPVVIAAAGMEASLPSVLGGQVPGLVIALPTSNGYGISAGGRVALEAALSSCAPGLAVVNIDNGYGAACLALRALRIARAPSHCLY
ncbi:nickel pincer cofactor biosynthesis protein LarB [Thioalkalivibrio sp. HK1]|uniref:nickel pincer cofactor biosynthesis protein LarB n=1 Tax=Thioalkalivibrio sp. HK1 TaxID=1469245 RepID=UPI0004706277|nr:nickel pincer cofactor biosynthesis protein LarB [Thioalkalivibrio sp. HK1]